MKEFTDITTINQGVVSRLYISLAELGMLSYDDLKHCALTLT